MLQYSYDRNKNATSVGSKRGFAIRIGDIGKELEASHGLTQPCRIGSFATGHG